MLRVPGFIVDKTRNTEHPKCSGMFRVPGFIDALVSKDSALSFPVAAKTLNPKRLTAKKQESILREHHTKNT